MCPDVWREDAPACAEVRFAAHSGIVWAAPSKLVLPHEEGRCSLHVRSRFSQVRSSKTRASRWFLAEKPLRSHRQVLTAWV